MTANMSPIVAANTTHQPRNFKRLYLGQIAARFTTLGPCLARQSLAAKEEGLTIDLTDAHKIKKILNIELRILLLVLFNLSSERFYLFFVVHILITWIFQK